MKLATFVRKGLVSWGAVTGYQVADLGAILGGRFAGLRSLLAADALEEAHDALDKAPRYDQSEITWEPVIPNPAKILCIGLNYETHRKETERAPTAHPAVFTRWADTQIGHGADIIRPRISSELDYEGELAIIIGKAGRYIAEVDAMEHVAGYSPYNDGSIRDWQRHTLQFTPGKNFPGTGAFGPWMVTADEIDNISSHRIQTRLNGEVMQDAGFDQFIFSIPEIIAYCSSFTALNPGDVISTGTPGGVGAKRNPPVFMKSGDVVEIDITGVGTLVNRVADER